MHVLITGGAGFIGSHLVELHLERGDHVLAIDDLSTGSPENVRALAGHPRFRLVESDLAGWPALAESVTWADRIYHLAAVVGMFNVVREPIKVIETNIGSCVQLLREVAQSRWKPQVIIASSSEVFGVSRRTRMREDDELVIHSGAKTRWNYAISKLASESIGLSYFQQENVRVVLIRIFNTIGPRETGAYGMVVPRFIEQAVSGRPITIFGDGKQTRSFCDVRDTVTAFALLADQPAANGEIVNVGNDREISIGRLAQMVRERAGSASPLEHIPYEKAYGKDFEDVARRCPDLEKLRRLTAFQHRWTLEQTLDDLLAKARGERSR